MAGGRRRLLKEELPNLYASYNIIRMIKQRNIGWVGHVAHIGVVRNDCRILVEKPEGKRSLGRTRRRWEDNIRMDLREIRCEVVDWMHLVQDRNQ
jgi:hypothetical protein